MEFEQKNDSYLDKEGKPRLRTSVVGFLDILGFSNIATAHAQVEDSQQVLDKIVVSIQDSRSFVRQALPDDLNAENPQWVVKYFSDNLVLGYPIEAADAASRAAAAWLIVRCAQRYQLRMALNGWFQRGALTLGPICLTEEIVFGSALIECYELESKASIVPRVLVSEPLQQLVLNRAQASAADRAAVGEALCRDVDDRWFVNYLDATREPGGVDWWVIERHKQAVLKSLAGVHRHDVLPKFGWACRYHNVFCHWHRKDPKYSDRFRIDRTDEQSTMNRWCELNPTAG